MLPRINAIGFFSTTTQVRIQSPSTPHNHSDLIQLDSFLGATWTHHFRNINRAADWLQIRNTSKALYYQLLSPYIWNAAGRWQLNEVARKRNTQQNFVEVGHQTPSIVCDVVYGDRAQQSRSALDNFPHWSILHITSSRLWILSCHRNDFIHCNHGPWKSFPHDIFSPRSIRAKQCAASCKHCRRRIASLVIEPLQKEPSRNSWSAAAKGQWTEYTMELHFQSYHEQCQQPPSKEICRTVTQIHTTRRNDRATRTLPTTFY